MAVQEIRIPIKRKQFELISELQRAVQDLDRQAMMAVHGVIAGADEDLTNSQFKGLEAKDGVFSMVFEKIAPEAPEKIAPEAPEKIETAE
jgi:hypothetical protein